MLTPKGEINAKLREVRELKGGCMCHVGRECGLTIMGKWCDSKRGIRGKACGLERVRRKVLTGRGVEQCGER